MTKSRIGEQIPSLKNWGGVRSIQKRMERSGTILNNKEAIAYTMLALGNTKLSDIITWDENGNVKVKASSQIPEYALQAIKSIKVRTDRDGNSTLDIELFDKVGVLRLLAKASGLLDSPDDGDKPSVIDVNVVAPQPREQNDQD
jgi:hypothetical protein